MDRTAITGMRAIILSLGLAATVSAAGPAAQDPPRAYPTSPAGLPSDTFRLMPAPVGVESKMDASLLRAAQVPPVGSVPAPADPIASDPRASGEVTPTVAPFPVAQQRPTPAQPSRAGQQVPPSPPPAPRGRQSQARPAPAEPRDIQFDRDGLITMHTNELDVRQLLELISRRSGMNILVSPRVSGTITANFEKVTLDQLLQSVLKLANLVVTREGSIHFIYTQEELQAQSESKMKERIVTKVYKLNYIRADELMALIRPFLSEDVGQRRIQSTANYPFGISESPAFSTGTAGGGGGVGGAMGGVGGTMGGSGGAAAQRGMQPTSGGTSTADSDHLVIQDYESNLKIVDQIIQRLDVQPIQILIEAVIISVELDRTKQLGVNFGVVDNLGQELGTIGSGAVLNGNVGFTPSSVLTAAGKIAGGAAATAAAATTDINGFTSDTNGIKFGFVSNNVTGFIRALDILGSTKILASPRILVLNKQRAEIQLGSRLGFKGITSQNFTSTTQAIQFLNTGTLLRLRPFVSSDGMVRMEIHPERSQGVVDPTTGLPSATTAELTTNVMVPGGATLVIGGLMEDEDNYQQQGLPGLSRIPGLGALFGLKQKTNNRRELVVLLTPRIWTQSQPHFHPPHLATRAIEDESAEPGATRTSATPAESVSASAPVPASRRTATPESASPESAVPSVALRTEPRRHADPRTVGVQPWLGMSPAPSAASPASGLIAAPTPLNPPTAPTSAPGPLLSRGQARGVQQHLVQQGETFQTIARRYYGSERYAPALWQANREVVQSPSQLGSDLVLAIPPQAQLDPAMVAAAAMMTSAPAPGPGPESGIVGTSVISDPARTSGLNASSFPPSGSASGPQRRTTYADKVDPMATRAGLDRTMRPNPLPQEIVTQARTGPSASEPRPTPRRRGVADCPQRHVVQSGENFMTIAQAYYGSEHYAMALWWANRGTITWPELLKAGTTIVVPAVDQLTTSSIIPSDSKSWPDREPAPEPVPVSLGVPMPKAEPELELPGQPRLEPASMTVRRNRTEDAGADSIHDEHDPRSGNPAPSGGYAVHVVRRQETLRSIARDRLGDVRRSGEIADLNWDILGENDRLTPGQRLLLPADARPPRPMP